MTATVLLSFRRGLHAFCGRLLTSLLVHLRQLTDVPEYQDFGTKDFVMKGFVMKDFVMKDFVMKDFVMKDLKILACNKSL